jgi:hypothetical protein
MSDLEPVGQIIPRVLDAAAQAAEEAERVELAARIRALPTRTPRGDAEIREWVEQPRLLEWPHQLRIRLLQALQAAQTLDIDQTIRMIIELEHEAGLIERRHEHVAMRLSPPPPEAA